jgi:hypothetical protein
MIGAQMVVPMLPVILRGIRAADPEELARELADQLRDYLAEPGDVERVAQLCGLVSFYLAPDRRPVPRQLPAGG